MENLIKLAKELGKSPTARECDECIYTSSVSTYRRKYGSWSNAKESAGLKTSKSWNESSLRSSIKKLIEELGRFPTNKECDECVYTASYKTYNSRLGWNNLKREFGCHVLSKEESIEALGRLAVELGGAPTELECGACKYTSSVSSYAKYFGSWVAALGLIGFNIKSKSKLSDEQILDDYGCVSNSTYARRFGSVTKARELAGCSIDKISREELMFSMKRFFEEFGRAPLSKECLTTDYLYGSVTYALEFGSWLKAIDASGIERNSRVTSIPENEILDYIKSIYSGEIITSDRTIIYPKELDIVLPELKLAFEFDGLYWHSSDRLESGYHLNKTNLAAKRGYKLIHILESEWEHKRSIVESRIGNLLGISKRLYARKCSVHIVAPMDSREFLETNHLQGNVNASVRLGLYYEGELVSLQTFSKPRFNSNYEYELIRFANKCGLTVVGGASKLFMYFLNKYMPDSVISYSDKRWGSGGLYTNLGFKHLRDSKPNYWYFKNNGSLILESRVKYQKHKLANLLDEFDVDKTEAVNMEIAGYLRIYDCGNGVFVWE